MLTETGLDDSINSLQIFGTSFNVFRCDRSPLNSDKRSFGGALIAVAARHGCSRIDTDSGRRLEQVCVSANIHGHRFLMCNIYIPPDNSRKVDLIEEHIATVRELCDNASYDDTVLVCGDYNQPRIAWYEAENGIRPGNPTLLTPACTALVDGMDFLNLNQVNVQLNNLGRTLDLVFTSDGSCVYTAEESLLPVDLHHPPLSIRFDVPPERPASLPVANEPERALNYRKIDFDALIAHLSGLDWNCVFGHEDVHDMASNFCNVIRQWLISNVPVKRQQLTPPWSTPLLRRSKLERNQCQRRLRAHKTTSAKANFKRASNDYRKLNAALYKSHVLKVQFGLRRDPKSFWGFVNSKRKNPSVPPNVIYDGREAKSESEACNFFAKHFASIFQSESSSDVEAEHAASNVVLDAVDLDTFEISPAMIIGASKRLKSSFAPGPDGIPAVVLRRCASAVAEPLAFIFNRSFEQCEFPLSWKLSHMFPVHKSGDRRDVKNYRGITSLPAASKLFEIIVSDHILRATKTHISTDQHGFIPGRSVATNLLDLTTTCFAAMEEKVQVDVIYTDLKAAFDKIDHKVLLCKLSRLGASNRLVSWFSSYLTGRMLHVKHGSCVSLPFASTSGVPQGSNLGPILFVIFFNDVASSLGFRCKLVYADDLKIYVVVRCIEDCIHLQMLVNLFVRWCRSNKLVISIAKCHVMTFHRSKDPIMFEYRIDDTVLNRVDQVTDLGVVLDSKLTFHSHYSSIISKANRQLGFISKIAKDFTDPHCLKALYCSLVRPILENASVVWAPNDVTWNLRIERVQKRFIRLALRNLPWRDPLNLPAYPDRCRLLSLETLDQRRKIQQATFVVKLLNGDVDCSHLLSLLNFRASGRMLRQRSLMQPGFHRTLYGYNQPICAMVRLFESVESVFDFGMSTSQFVNRVRRLNLI